MLSLYNTYIISSIKIKPKISFDSVFVKTIGAFDRYKNMYILLQWILRRNT